MTFLTVWILAKTQLADVLPDIIESSEEMRTPHTGADYRHVALDICTIYFFAISFYFCLMFAVAHDTFHVTEALEHFEGVAQVPKKSRRASVQASAVAMGSIATADQEFLAVKKHFVHHMHHAMANSPNPTYKEIGRLLNDDLNRFPLSKYLKFEVRL